MLRNRAFIATSLITCATLAAAGCGSASAPTSQGSDASPTTRRPPSTSIPPSTPPHAMDHSTPVDHGGHDMTQRPLPTRRAAATTAERAAADDVFARTRASLARFAAEPDAVAAGFTPSPGATGRVIHYRNLAYRRDGHELDPDRPEGLVYARGRTGALVLLGAVFTARPGESAPAPAGDIFRWHTHDPRCETFLVPAGGCTDTFRMLHIWTTTAADVVDPWTQPFRAARGHPSAP